MCIRTAICALFVVLVFNGMNSAVFARDVAYTEVSSNSKIVSTLNVLKNHNATSHNVLKTILGDNLTHKPIKIMFYNLSSMGFEFEKMDAVACKKRNSDRIYILINDIHKNAPPEALASILSHETIHQDDESSLAEEVTGWTNEAKSWLFYTRTNPNLKYQDCALVRRLNTLADLYAKAGYTSEKIADTIYSNLGYASLPQYSQGFGKI